MTFDMSLIIKIIPDLPSQTPPSNVAMQGRSGSFIQEVLVQNYTLGSIGFTELNNSEVTFTASMSKVKATNYTFRPLTVILTKQEHGYPSRVGILGNR